MERVSERAADGRHLMLVGSGAGIGAAVAARFAAEGCRLTLVARNADRLATIAARLRDGGAEVRELSADAGSPYGLRAALAPIVAADPPGVLVYNAALSGGEDLLGADDVQLASAYAVNVVGAIVAVQLVTPGMRVAGAGTVLITGRALTEEPARRPVVADPARLGSGPTHSLATATLQALALRLSDQLADVPVHVATVSVSAPEPAHADLDRIGSAYWTIHAEPRAEWRAAYQLTADRA